MKLDKEFCYSIPVKFEDIGHGLIGKTTLYKSKPALILPDNWIPQPNESATCDIFVSESKFNFNGIDYQIAFARVSPIYNKPKIISPKKQQQKLKKAKPKKLTVKHYALPTRPTKLSIVPGAYVVFDTRFYDDGRCELNKNIWIDKGTKDNQYVIKVMYKHNLPTSHLAVAKKQAGHTGLFKMPKDKTIKDIIGFRINKVFTNFLDLVPKFDHPETYIKKFTIPKEFQKYITNKNIKIVNKNLDKLNHLM